MPSASKTLPQRLSLAEWYRSCVLVYFFNVASEDQWREGPFRADEPYRLEFMHPERSRIEGSLPGAVARCPACSSVLMVLVTRHEVTCVDLPGLAALERPG